MSLADEDVDAEVVLARAYLSRVAEPANLALWLFVRELGPVDAACAVRAGRVPDAVGSATAARRTSADPEADLAAAAERGIRLVAPESGEWPHFAFAALERAVAPLARAFTHGSHRRDDSGDPVPPLALWVRGDGTDLAGLGIRTAAIVGSRAATSYGEHVTAEFAYGLAQRGVTVASGGAYGIDAAAHRAALAAGGCTVVVSAGGLDRPYPSGNALLYERAAASGLVISESPPGCAPHRFRFLTRNRLIAALSSGVVVVEASARSGALNTARHARTLGRPVLAVPGPVTSAMSVGCHDLLRRETAPAVLAGCVDDVLAVVGSVGEGLSAGSGSLAGVGAADGPGPGSDAAGAGSGGGSVPDVRAELDGLPASARRVFDGLPAARFVSPDELAVRSGVSPLDVVRSLPALELAGLVETREGQYRVAGRVRSRKPP